MRFPLNHKAIGGYRFGQWTFYATKHKGTDWEANYVPLYAPADGRLESWSNDLGGNWVWFRHGAYLHGFCHLSGRSPIGNYKEGQQIGTTGNSGTLTTAPHLHEQIYFNGNLIDPEGFYQEGDNLANERRDIDFLANEVRPQIKKLNTDVGYMRTQDFEKDVYPNIKALQKAVADLQTKAGVPISVEDTQNLSTLKRVLDFIRSLFK